MLRDVLELHLVELLEDLDVIVEPEGVEGDGGEAAGHPEDGEDERARADGDAAAVGETLRRHLGIWDPFFGNRPTLVGTRDICL